MNEIGKKTAVHLVMGVLSVILTVLIVLFLGAVADCVASDPAERQCQSRARTAAAVAFDRQHLRSGGLMFQTTYREEDWAGDVSAVCVDGNGEPSACQCEDMTGTPGPCLDPFDPGRPELKWSVDQVAADSDAGSAAGGNEWWRQRAVITMHSDYRTGVPFRYESLSSQQRNSLRNDPDLVAYIRGDRSLEGSRFRPRSSYYGDFLNFLPTSYSSVLLAGANDGMLHVFDTASGHEYFSYVPGLVYRRWVDGPAGNGGYQENLAVLGDHDYPDNHRYFVDGGAAVKYLEDGATTLAAGSLGRGGPGVFGLNLYGIRGLDDVEAQAEQVVMWEYPDPSLADDPYIGKVYGRPQVVKLPHPEAPGYKWCVIFGNGYGSHFQVPVLYILDAYEGSVVKRIIASIPVQPDGTNEPTGCSAELGCNGLSTPELVDSDDDGLIDLAYAGDLQGNLWKFDFSGGSIFGPDGYAVAFQGPEDDESSGNWVSKPLLSVRDRLDRPQPIMTKPTVIRPCQGSAAGLMVLFGTGRLEQTDTASDEMQSIYGIWDWQDIWRDDPGMGIDPVTSYYGEVVFSDPDETPPHECVERARKDCEVNCRMGCAGQSTVCEQSCTEAQMEDEMADYCSSECRLQLEVCKVDCGDLCLAAAGGESAGAACEAEAEEALHACLDEAAGEADEQTCSDQYRNRSAACAAYRDAYLGCSTRRTFSNMAEIFSIEQAEFIGLLEQHQTYFAGLDYYEEDDPEVIGGQAGKGGIKRFDDAPVDLDQYDRVIRILSDRQIDWLSLDSLTHGLVETEHVGWVFDMPLEGERLASDPVVYDGVLYYATSFSSSGLCNGGHTMMMGQQACSGGQPQDTLFDLDGDEQLGGTDSIMLFDLGTVNQISGYVATDAVSAPVIISSADRDFIFIPERFGEAGSEPDDGGSLPSTWNPPGIEKTVTRGKNLGLCFWRELF